MEKMKKFMKREKAEIETGTEKGIILSHFGSKIIDCYQDGLI